MTQESNENDVIREVLWKHLSETHYSVEPIVSDLTKVVARVLDQHRPQASQYGPDFCSCSPLTGRWVRWSGQHVAEALTTPNIPPGLTREDDA